MQRWMLPTHQTLVLNGQSGVQLSFKHRSLLQNKRTSRPLRTSRNDYMSSAPVLCPQRTRTPRALCISACFIWAVYLVKSTARSAAVGPSVLVQVQFNSILFCVAPNHDIRRLMALCIVRSRPHEFLFYNSGPRVPSTGKRLCDMKTDLTPATTGQRRTIRAVRRRSRGTEGVRMSSCL